MAIKKKIKRIRQAKQNDCISISDVTEKKLIHIEKKNEINEQQKNEFKEHNIEYKIENE